MFCLLLLIRLPTEKSVADNFYLAFSFGKSEGGDTIPLAQVSALCAASLLTITLKMVVLDFFVQEDID